jgi:putative membrane protein
MRYLFWIIALPILALAGAFAAANHAAVTLSLWPLPYDMAMPTYVVVLGAFALGFLLAALWMWLSGLPVRFARRRLAREERKLEDENHRLREELDDVRARAAHRDDADAARRLIVAGGD